jgi:hypothetical protein
LGLKEYIRNVSTAKGAQIQLGREKLEQKKQNPHHWSNRLQSHVKDLLTINKHNNISTFQLDPIVVFVCSSVVTFASSKHGAYFLVSFFTA